jgi:hypothetical protein
LIGSTVTIDKLVLTHLTRAAGSHQTSLRSALDESDRLARVSYFISF